MIYLDSAATTLQKPPSVPKAVAQALATMTSPGRGNYGPAARASQTLLACREAAAERFRVGQPERVVLTFNATHGLNIAVRSLVRPGQTVVLSGYEHNAVTRPLAMIPGVRVKLVKAPLFRPDLFLEEFERQLTGEVDAAVFTHVSNVFGYALPMEQAAALCRRNGVPFLVDASQSAGVLPVPMDGWGAEFIAMPGHKGLYGPQGNGLLLGGGAAEPLLEGGTGSVSLRQEMPDFLPDRLEAGTHNIAGIAGLLEGLRFLRRREQAGLAVREEKLIRRLGEGLSRLPGTEVYLAPRDSGAQSGVLSFRVRDRDCEELGELLGRRGIALRAGLHCAPLAHRTAGTLESGTLRASVSAFTLPEEIGRALAITEELLREEAV